MVGGYYQRDDTNNRWDEMLSPTAVVAVLLDLHQETPCRSHRRFSLGFETLNRDIGDEHMPWRVRDHHRHVRREGNCLRGDATCPEDGHFAGLERERLAPIGLCEVGDAETRGVTDMDRCAVRPLVSGGDAHGVCDLVGAD